MDHAVTAMWDGFESAAWLTHLPLFEACVAVMAFVMWIAFFESLHLWLPRAEEHRLDKQKPVRPLSGFSSAIHKTTVPAITYLLSIHLFQVFGLSQLLFGVKPVFDEAPTFFRLVTEVSMGVFLYDLLFYPFHYSFHTARHIPGWRAQHGRHHQWGSSEAAAHNAVETVQNSYLDAGIQVFINICVQNVSPWGGIAHKHPLSRILHNLMVTYLLSEAHSGYDLPFQSHRLFPALFGGAPRHEEHHQTGQVCFHQFFKYLDDARGLGPRALPPHLARSPLAWSSAAAERAAAVSRGRASHSSGDSSMPLEGTADARRDDDSAVGAEAVTLSREANVASAARRRRTLEEMITGKRGASRHSARERSTATAKAR